MWAQVGSAGRPSAPQSAALLRNRLRATQTTSFPPAGTHQPAKRVLAPLPRSANSTSRPRTQAPAGQVAGGLPARTGCCKSHVCLQERRGAPQGFPQTKTRTQVVRMVAIYIFELLFPRSTPPARQHRGSPVVSLRKALGMQCPAQQGLFMIPFGPACRKRHVWADLSESGWNLLASPISSEFA